MGTLTPAQLQLLRAALGLSCYATRPTRNWLPPHEVRDHEADVDALVGLGYLARRDIIGQRIESVIEITPAGEQLAMSSPQP